VNKFENIWRDRKMYLYKKKFIKRCVIRAKIKAFAHLTGIIPMNTSEYYMIYTSVSIPLMACRKNP
jgi:hypothetical protein